MISIITIVMTTIINPMVTMDDSTMGIGINEPWDSTIMGDRGLKNHNVMIHNIRMEPKVEIA